MATVSKQPNGSHRYFSRNHRPQSWLAVFVSSFGLLDSSLLQEASHLLLDFPVTRILLARVAIHMPKRKGAYQRGDTDHFNKLMELLEKWLSREG